MTIYSLNNPKVHRMLLKMIEKEDLRDSKLIYSDYHMRSQVMAYLNMTRRPVNNQWFGNWVYGTEHWSKFYKKTVQHFIDIGFMKVIGDNKWKRLADISYEEIIYSN